jgi:hypothetical protein
MIEENADYHKLTANTEIIYDPSEIRLTCPNRIMLECGQPSSGIASQEDARSAK